MLTCVLDLSGGDVSVAEDGLDGGKVGPAIQQGLRGNVPDSGGFGLPSYDFPTPLPPIGARWAGPHWLAGQNPLPPASGHRSDDSGTTRRGRAHNLGFRNWDMDQKKYLQETGREYGRKGGQVRASRLTPEQRSEIAKKAARARWAKRK
jgi:hypothetical protein